MITTLRLDLVPATVALIRAALSDAPALSAALAATVPPTWPPELLDRPALEFTLDVLRRNPDQVGWWLYFVLQRTGTGGRGLGLAHDNGGRGLGLAPTLIGSVGYKGPPTEDGTVEVGYGIVEDHRRQGYASEATRGLVAHAFAHPATRRVVAETYPELTASIRVMQSCGFTFLGAGSEPGVIQYGLSAETHSRQVRNLHGGAT